MAQDDDTELQFPFPLPPNFSGDVETDLANRSMTSKTMAAFMTAVAHSVFAKKKYPSRLDFDAVARFVVDKYPFMLCATGTGYVSYLSAIYQYRKLNLHIHRNTSGMLKERLKRFRRKRSVDPSCQSPSPSVPRRKKAVCRSLCTHSCEVPCVLPGEDEESYVRHTRKLVELSTKKSTAADTVNVLMEWSYALRRKRIVETMPSVMEILESYPFLGRTTQVWQL